METVKVKKDDLIKEVQKNRDNHRKEFEKALEDYRLWATHELEEAIKELKKGSKIQRMLHFPVPEDHTADYDRILKMLEMGQEQIIKLSQRDFAMYAMDDFGWKTSFEATNSGYASNVMVAGLK